MNAGKYSGNKIVDVIIQAYYWTRIILLVAIVLFIVIGLIVVL